MGKDDYDYTAIPSPPFSVRRSEAKAAVLTLRGRTKMITIAKRDGDEKMKMPTASVSTNT
jgi:hypothetical protein